MRKLLAGLIALVALIGLGVLAYSRIKPSIDWSTRDEVPPEELSSVMEAHYRGLGAMERYEYAKASSAFGEVHRKAPGWSVGSINLAIALLNQGGEAENKAKGAGQEAEADVAVKSNLDESLRLLGEVIARQPDNPWAHFSRGIILQDRGFTREAYEDFKKVTEVDPLDPNAWLERGSTLTDPSGSMILPGSKLLPDLVNYYSKALELNPYLTTAMFKLATAAGYSADRVRQKALLDRDRKFDPKKSPEGPGERAVLAYGEMGRYARIIDPFPRSKAPGEVAVPPRFEFPVEINVALPPASASNEMNVSLPARHRWARSSDFIGPLAVIGRARARFGPGIATFDADNDGKLDLYLTSAIVGPKGVRDLFLRNLGDNKYDGTETFGLPDDRAGLGVAAGDFDGDRRVDLFLTGVGDNRLYRNVVTGFRDVTREAGIEPSAAISPSARWLDLDQDGDLDLYVLNYAAASDADKAFLPSGSPAGLVNLAYRNDGKPAEVQPRPEDNWAPLAMSTPDLLATKGLSIGFSAAFPGLGALEASRGNHTAVVALDIDDDRDIDLVVSADSGPPLAILNDRGGAFRLTPLMDIKPDAPISGMLVIDLDKDGRPDVVAIGPGGRASAWRNASKREGSSSSFAFEAAPIDAMNWQSAHAVDLDLDTWPDLVGLRTDDPLKGLSWARNSGTRFESAPIAVPPDGSEKTPDGGIRPGRPGGRPAARPPPDPRRPGPLASSGIWATATTGWRSTSRVVGRPASTTCGPTPRGSAPDSRSKGRGSMSLTTTRPRLRALGQSVGPVVLGMGASTSAPLLRVRWPDGVMQCELNVTADKTPDRRRGQPEDRQLPGPFHVERLEVRVPGRLLRRRRPRLSRGPRRSTASPTATSRSPSPPISSSPSTGSTASASSSRWTRSPTSTS